ncbi:MAG: penicillin-binding protein 2 [Actinomycetia bacterium]|nr:penicillin-binding protein 2 [Actinomycetes bacterium]
MSSSASTNARRRLIALLCMFLVAFAVLVGQLVDLQTIKPDRYIEYGEKQRSRQRDLAGSRGRILDRNGVDLALSLDRATVVADPNDVKDPLGNAVLLAEILSMDQAGQLEIQKALTAGGRYSTVARFITDEQAALVAEQQSAGRLTGIFLEEEPERQYPQGDLARSVIGRTDDYSVGSTGLEKVYDQTLTGKGGHARFEGTGTLGGWTIAGGEAELVEPRSGHDLVLTIDHRIQHVVEEIMVEQVDTYQAEQGVAVVLEPATGDILAMASVGRGEDGQAQIIGQNLAVTASFPPGSVLKAVTMAASIEEGLSTADRWLTVEPVYRFLEIPYSDQNIGRYETEEMTVTDILARSSNVGTIRLAEELRSIGELDNGADVLAGYLDRFGFGQYSSLDLPLQTRGRVKDPIDWYDSDFGGIPIGQGITATPLQIASAYAAIANGGMQVAPKLVHAVVDGGSDAERAETPRQVDRSKEADRVISASTADELTDMLVEVVERGTGTGGAVPGYTVAGKTGTAWKWQAETESFLDVAGVRHYILDFAGFVPAERPELAIVVLFDDPQGFDSAGAVAAPVFSQIAEYALRILGVPPGSGDGAGSTDLVRAAPAPQPGVAEQAVAVAPADEADADG